MKKKIAVFEHMGEILNGVKNGVLITGKADGRVNSMTISWGMVGVEWGKPVFITFVRESRFTRSLLEKNGEFTVNIPLDDSAKKILGYCGAKSGRDVDKAKEIGGYGPCGKLICAFFAFLFGSLYIVPLIGIIALGIYIIFNKEYPFFFNSSAISAVRLHCHTIAL